MIDLHCHLLPGIDDGAHSLEESLDMARCAVDDGITVVACTPHIYPGLYENTGAGIRLAISALQTALDEAGISLRLVEGADVQLALGMRDGLSDGSIPRLAGSKYFLFEPPHHVAPARLEDVAQDLLTAGFVPIVTHPERLSWIEDGYPIMIRLSEMGCWMQLTAGSITGMFGRRPQYWSERLLDEGRVHIIATDAHNLRRRRPVLSEARQAVARRLGEDAASDMVLRRPQGVLDDVTPNSLPATIGRRDEGGKGMFGLFRGR